MESAKKKSALYWIYTLVTIVILVANKAFESSCWFYSDAKGEFSFSELLTDVLYLIGAVVLVGMAVRHKKWVLLLPGALCFLLLLEEANYGQIFWGDTESTYFENEEQASLHTQLLRPVFLYGTMDMAEVLSIVMLGFFMIVVPLGLRYLLKMREHPALLWTPLAFACLCHLGKWQAILVPWSCGYDAFEEMVETLMAGTVMYWILLYRLHFLKQREEATFQDQ